MVNLFSSEQKQKIKLALDHYTISILKESHLMPESICFFNSLAFSQQLKTLYPNVQPFMLGDENLEANNLIVMNLAFPDCNLKDILNSAYKNLADDGLLVIATVISNDEATAVEKALIETTLQDMLVDFKEIRHRYAIQLNSYVNFYIFFAAKKSLSKEILTLIAVKNYLYDQETSIMQEKKSSASELRLESEEEELENELELKDETEQEMESDNEIEKDEETDRDELEVKEDEKENNEKEDAEIEYEEAEDLESKEQSEQESAEDAELESDELKENEGQESSERESEQEEAEEEPDEEDSEEENLDESEKGEALEEHLHETAHGLHVHHELIKDLEETLTEHQENLIESKEKLMEEQLSEQEKQQEYQKFKSKLDHLKTLTKQYQQLHQNHVHLVSDFIKSHDKALEQGISKEDKYQKIVAHHRELLAAQKQILEVHEELKEEHSQFLESLTP